MRVRRLEAADADLGETVVRTFKGTAAPEVSAGIRRFLSDPDNVLLVAEAGGQPAGFLVAYVLDRVDRDRPMVCLYEIEVAASRRRQGVGAALVAALKALCRGRAVMKIWVIASRSNTAAMRLYEAAGARPGAGPDDVVLVWSPVD